MPQAPTIGAGSWVRIKGLSDGDKLLVTQIEGHRDAVCVWGVPGAGYGTIKIPVSMLESADDD